MTTKTQNAIDTITLHYDLASLPTAQHKAGLAGLILMIRTLEAREIRPVPVIECLDGYGATITFSRESLQTLFDDLFDAEWVETTTPKKRQSGKPVRNEIVVTTDANGVVSKERRYTYRDCIIRAAFLKDALLPPDADAWVKLFRDVVWTVVRSRYMTWLVYYARADGAHSGEAENTWKGLLASAKTRKKGEIWTERFGGSVFIGAQAENAEMIPFVGTPEENLLLHFWLIPSLLFAPQRFKVERESDQLMRINWENAGYVLAIPEPAHLEWFIDEAKALLSSLDTDLAGYRPKEAEIAVPAEGGLEYLYHLARHRIGQHPIADVIAAVEVYHLEKRGNNVAALAAERILPEPRVLDAYEALRTQCHNPDVKVCRIRSLLDGTPWYTHFPTVLESRPFELMIRSHRSPGGIASFRRDIRAKFDAIEETLKLTGDKAMPEDQENNALARRVYRLVGEYVNRRTEEKSGIRYEDFKNNKTTDNKMDVPQPYREAREKVCTDAFLAMRGRRDQDFVEYFAGTICSVPQFLPEEEYVAVSRALLDDWETVKTLSMLALSAKS